MGAPGLDKLETGWKSYIQSSDSSNIMNSLNELPASVRRDCHIQHFKSNEAQYFRERWLSLAPCPSFKVPGVLLMVCCKAW